MILSKIYKKQTQGEKEIMRILNDNPIDLKELISMIPLEKQYNVELANGVLAVAFFCIPIITVSTVLWQWLG
jgi:hypothetical protein